MAWGRRKIAERILKDMPEIMDEVVEAGYEDSAAQFTERCVEMAHEFYWSERSEAPYVHVA
jgi:hypothetical protein